MSGLKSLFRCIGNQAIIPEPVPISIGLNYVLNEGFGDSGMFLWNIDVREVIPFM